LLHSTTSGLWSARVQHCRQLFRPRCWRSRCLPPWSSVLRQSRDDCDCKGGTAQNARQDKVSLLGMRQEIQAAAIFTKNGFDLKSMDPSPTKPRCFAKRILLISRTSMPRLIEEVRGKLSDGDVSRITWFAGDGEGRTFFSDRAVVWKVQPEGVLVTHPSHVTQSGSTSCLLLTAGTDLPSGGIRKW
jgi:hypothetical protein